MSLYEEFERELSREDGRYLGTLIIGPDRIPELDLLEDFGPLNNNTEKCWRKT